MQKIKHFLFFILVLVVEIVQAKNVVDIAREFNEKLKFTRPNQCAENAVDAVDAEELNSNYPLQCVIDICGPLDKIESIVEQSTADKVWSDPRLKNSVGLFKQALLKEEEARRTTLNSAIETMSDSNFKQSREIFKEIAATTIGGFAKGMFGPQDAKIGSTGRLEVNFSRNAEAKAYFMKYFKLTAQDADVVLDALKDDPYVKLEALQGSGAAFKYDYLYPNTAFQISLRDDLQKYLKASQGFVKTPAASGLGLTSRDFGQVFSMADSNTYVDNEMGETLELAPGVVEV